MTKNKEQQFSNDGRIAALLTFCGFENEKGLSLIVEKLLLGQPLCAEKGICIHRYKISGLNYGVGFY